MNVTPWAENRTYEAISLDFSFPGTNNLYGLPERTSSFVLADDDYRLYAVDIFPHQENSTKGLYSGIPYVLGHNTYSTQSISWINTAETYANISSTKEGKTVTIRSETGAIDFFMIASLLPLGLQRKLAKVTGLPPLPPIYALGFHYSKWEQATSAYRMYEYVTRFNQSNIPLDMLWLDITSTDESRYFILSPRKFPPDQLSKAKKALRDAAKRAVVITDPHIKVDIQYHVFNAT